MIRRPETRPSFHPLFSLRATKPAMVMGNPSTADRSSCSPSTETATHEDDRDTNRIISHRCTAGQSEDPGSDARRQPVQHPSVARRGGDPPGNRRPRSQWQHPVPLAGRAGLACVPSICGLTAAPQPACNSNWRLQTVLAEGLQISLHNERRPSLQGINAMVGPRDRRHQRTKRSVACCGTCGPSRSSNCFSSISVCSLCPLGFIGVGMNSTTSCIASGTRAA